MAVFKITPTSSTIQSPPGFINGGRKAGFSIDITNPFHNIVRDSGDFVLKGPVPFGPGFEQINQTISGVCNG